MKVICTYKHINFYFSKTKSPAGYTCKVQEIKEIDKDEIELIGKHDELSMTNRDVIGVIIDRQPELKKFPRGFAKVFPNIRYMQINRCSITTLTCEDFKDLGHLQGLWMSENSIEQLPNNLFVNVQGIQYLSFYRNKLKYIGEHLLTPLKNLKAANFEGNTCINVSYKDENINELQKLKDEIKAKCVYSTENYSSNSNLLNRVTTMEQEIKRLQNDNREKDARIKQLENDIIKIKMAFNLN
ncbi:hypothetical protein PVAND_007100 [Polypedilum vanderplanki]|uniref:Leucine-rich repeat protein n=1 Tax=Polypedilum vanderplanki TaxID=319348 RepID=A0A9J6C573_POLVA|nr:hypothetical protein PVAND_007100 [Polypedilum vanderplanki]